MSKEYITRFYGLISSTELLRITETEIEPIASPLYLYFFLYLKKNSYLYIFFRHMQRLYISCVPVTRFT